MTDNVDEKKKPEPTTVERHAGAISGAVAGAVAGSFIPIVGTLAGAAIGAAIGHFGHDAQKNQG